MESTQGRDGLLLSQRRITCLNLYFDTLEPGLVDAPKPLRFDTVPLRTHGGFRRQISMTEPSLLLPSLPCSQRLQHRVAAAEYAMTGEEPVDWVGQEAPSRDAQDVGAFFRPNPNPIDGVEIARA